MSSGNTIVTTSSPYSLQGKIWNGTDGRYIYDVTGRRIVKWNSYQMSFNDVVDGVSSFDSRYTYTASGDQSSIWGSNDLLRLQSNLIEKVKGSDFNLAVTAAETPEFLRMVSDDARQIAKAFLAVRKGHLNDATEILFAGYTRRSKYADSAFFRRKPVHALPFKKPQVSRSAFLEMGISQRWLELQYGWLPTLNDIYNASKAYESMTNGPRMHVYRAKYSKSYPYDGSSTPSNYNAYGTKKASYKLYYRAQEDISAAHKLGLYDPLSVVWEVIPYSFVVDWFIPIGTYLPC